MPGALDVCSHCHAPLFARAADTQEFEVAERKEREMIASLAEPRARAEEARLSLWQTAIEAEEAQREAAAWQAKVAGGLAVVALLGLIVTMAALEAGMKGLGQGACVATFLLAGVAWSIVRG